MFTHPEAPYNLYETVKSIPLSGSEGQVKWARQLRQQTAKSLQELKPAGIARIIKPISHPTDLLHIRARSLEQINQTITLLCLHILQNPNARVWIDRRAQPLEATIQSAWKELRKSLSERSPFQ